MKCDIFGYPKAADYIGLSTSQLYRMVRRKRVRAYRLGHRSVQFRKADLDAFLESRSTTRL